MFDGEHCGVCGREMVALADVCKVTVQRFGGGSRQFFVCDKCADEFEDLAKDGEFKHQSPWRYEVLNDGR